MLLSHYRPLSKREVRARECGIEIATLIADGKTFSQAAKEMRITSTTAISFVQELICLLLDDRRWGWNGAVRSAFGKSLYLVFSTHYELLAEAVEKYRVEMRSGTYSHWQVSPRILVSVPRLRKKLPQPISWTQVMDARLGLGTDSKIAQELGVLGCHVQKRRIFLGIESFRSAVHQSLAQRADSQTRHSRINTRPASTNDPASSPW
jgi:hypothetical protein